MDISALTRDVAKIEAGDWVDEIPGMGSMRLRVRGIGSKVYTTKLSRLSRAVPRDERDRTGSLFPDASLRVMGEAMHETILLEWDGLTSGAKPFPFDSAVALQWLTDPAKRPFLDAVVFAANVVENGRAKTAEELEKN